MAEFRHSFPAGIAMPTRADAGRDNLALGTLDPSVDGAGHRNPLQVTCADT
jgi:hypothetical protein